MKRADRTEIWRCRRLWQLILDVALGCRTVIAGGAKFAGMQNPVLVEVLRGGLVESRHCGAVAVVDADGGAVMTHGDITCPVYPRSAVKALQALPLVESGRADAFTGAELAVMCSSHSGEPGHVATVKAILARIGLGASALRCGVHVPRNRAAAIAVIGSGLEPTALHNNCSGKHAGFLCLACQLGSDPQGYIEPSHPVQREVKAAIESVSGAKLSDDRRAVDGCSAPTWALPLADLALAFARFGTGRGLAPERANAAARLRAACAAQPWHVGGTERFCTEVMRLLGARVFVKTGAEGVYCAALPILGFGVALKCDDGAERAAEVMMASVIARLVDMSAGEGQSLERFLRPSLRNWNGIEVGSLRPAGPLANRR
jgi:L-asparaginase II